MKIYSANEFSETRTVVKGTALLEALHLKKNDALIKYLIQNGADVNADNTHHKTALIYAVEQNRTSLVKYLLEKGADPTTEYTFISESRTLTTAIYVGIFSSENVYSKETILELAQRKKYFDIVELLKQHGATN